VKKSAVTDEWSLDDWGPIPEPPASAWGWLRTAGEALLDHVGLIRLPPRQAVPGFHTLSGRPVYVHL